MRKCFLTVDYAALMIVSKGKRGGFRDQSTHTVTVGRDGRRVIMEKRLDIGRSEFYLLPQASLQRVLICNLWSYPAVRIQQSE
jgi:hypothetical protein